MDQKEIEVLFPHIQLQVYFLIMLKKLKLKKVFLSHIYLHLLVKIISQIHKLSLVSMVIYIF